MCTGRKLRKPTDDFFEDPKLYRSTIGALQYLTMTRPDITYTISKLNQFMEKPSNLHWQAYKRVLRYLKGTQQLGLNFRPGNISELRAYTNVDWASDVDDRKSTGGYCV